MRNKSLVQIQAQAKGIDNIELTMASEMDVSIVISEFFEKLQFWIGSSIKYGHGSAGQSACRASGQPLETSQGPLRPQEIFQSPRTNHELLEWAEARESDSQKTATGTMTIAIGAHARRTA